MEFLLESRDWVRHTSVGKEILVGLWVYGSCQDIGKQNQKALMNPQRQNINIII